jgi:hypothetical protein
MRSGVALRVALFACILLAMWTVALPALAAPAPYCDDRGASGMAAPPTLQPVDDAIQRARVLLPICPLDEQLLSSTIAPAHRSAARSRTPTEPALTTPNPAVVASPGEDLPPMVVHGVPLPGVRLRVERPPRG